MIEHARPDLASAMWPALSRETRAREAEQQRQAADYQRRKQVLLDGLREVNRKIDARLGKERRR